MRSLAQLLLYFVAILCAPIGLHANMASPYQGGKPSNEALSSQDIDILWERIHVHILDKQYAQYTVVYHISTERQGMQVPLVFDTEQRNSDIDFSVSVDGLEVVVRESTDDGSKSNYVISFFNALDDIGQSPKKYQYFEVDLSIGEHTIEVQYKAEAQVYSGDLVREYSFIYNLEPARRWRSFGKLDVEVDASVLPHSVTVFDSTLEHGNIGKWQFNALPDDQFAISYKPPVGALARMLHKLGAESFTFFLFGLLACLHVWLILKYRRVHPKKRFSWITLVGTLVVILVSSFSYLLFIELIDLAIGEEASRRHGYVILLPLILIVFFTIPYFLVSCLIDWWEKRRLAKRVESMV